jgi:hypothetical protein
MNIQDPMDVAIKPQVKTGGRPKKLMTPHNHPTYLQFLALFGLSGWDDKREWTIAHIDKTKAIDKYFKMKADLLSLTFPRSAAKKLEIQNRPAFISKDLITLLSQFGRLFGYTVKSQNKCIKPSSKNNLRKPINYQIYHLTKDTERRALLADALMQTLPTVLQDDKTIESKPTVEETNISEDANITNITNMSEATDIITMSEDTNVTYMSDDMINLDKVSDQTFQDDQPQIESQTEAKVNVAIRPKSSKRQSHLLYCE